MTDPPAKSDVSSTVSSDVTVADSDALARLSRAKDNLKSAFREFRSRFQGRFGVVTEIKVPQEDLERGPASEGPAEAKEQGEGAGHGGNTEVEGSRGNEYITRIC